MYINRLTAAFGRRERKTLELAPGLNIVETPSPADGAAWTALLRALLYGWNAQASGAEPLWSGVTEGRMELSTPRGDVTILRRAARTGSSAGSFSAVCTGAGTPAVWLTGPDCGEALLGVPQSTFIRGTCIGRAGTGAEPIQELERRIASLVTTGQEDASFSEAGERLRRLLSAHRSNDRTGLLPQTEQEIQDLRHILAGLNELTRSIVQEQEALEDLRARLRETDELLARHDAADQADILRNVESVRLDAASARDRVKTLEAGARALPTRPELEALQSRIDTLSSINWTAEEARSRLDIAAHDLRAAEEALEAHPCAGLTPAEAAGLPVDPGPAPVVPRWILPVSIAAGLLLAATGYFTQNWLASVGGGLGLFSVINLLVQRRFRKEKTVWEANRAQLIRQRDETAETYVPLYEAAEKALANYKNAQGAWETVSLGAKASLDAVLGQLRSFRPMVRDLDEAVHALDLAFEMRGELDLAIRQEETLRSRWEALREAAPPIPTTPAQRPELTREQLRLRRSGLLAEDEAVCRRLHAALGRLQALGDPQELALRLEALEARRERLQREYDAAALAMEVLFTAGSALQTDFSPALRESASGIFTKLTGEKYNRGMLDGEGAPSGQEAERLRPGTVHQLYLAVRLALGGMLLPEEDAVPLLLDNALADLDDQRMASALDYFLELSARRQILLFTCQRREGDYLNWAYPDRFRYIKEVSS